jgi:hypothetical protein
VVEIAFYVVYDSFSDRIGDISVLSGSLNILEMLDVCVVTFESMTELCITGDEGDSTYGEG